MIKIDLQKTEICEKKIMRNFHFGGGEKDRDRKCDRNNIKFNVNLLPCKTAGDAFFETITQ